MQSHASNGEECHCHKVSNGLKFGNGDWLIGTSESENVSHDLWSQISAAVSVRCKTTQKSFLQITISRKKLMTWKFE